MRTSGNPAAKIWKTVMGRIHEDLPYREFATPQITYQPPVPGIREIEYTIRHRVPSGREFYTETKSAPLGQEVTETAPSYPDFHIVGDETITIVICENPERNNVVFVYQHDPLTATAPPPATPPSAAPAPPSAEPPPPDENEPPAYLQF
jgi:hypothetical protein